MLERLGEHRDRILDLLRESPNVDLLEVDYANLLEDPRPQLERLSQFCGIDRVQLDKMTRVIDLGLRHFHTALG